VNQQHTHEWNSIPTMVADEPQANHQWVIPWSQYLSK